jgi:hypothetical protein
MSRLRRGGIADRSPAGGSSSARAGRVARSGVAGRSPRPRRKGRSGGRNLAAPQVPPVPPALIEELRLLEDAVRRARIERLEGIASARPRNAPAQPARIERLEETAPSRLGGTAVRKGAAPQVLQPVAQQLSLIEERVRGAAYDLRDAADGRHGADGPRLRKLEREAADVIAGECGRLRVLILYLTGGVPPPAERGFTERDRAGRSPAVFDNAAPHVRAPAQPEPGRS